MKKIIILSITFILITVFLITGVAIAGPAEKATGDVSYIAVGLRRYAEFSVFEEVDNRTAKGTLVYSDYSGGNKRWYETDIRCVVVDENTNTAYFGGQVVSASYSGWVGNWSHWAVFDGGEPAEGVDLVWGIFASSDPCATGYNLATAPGSSYTVDIGNLQVHTYNK